MTKVAFVQCTFARDWDRTRKHVLRLADKPLDYIIIVTDETVSKEEIEKLKRVYEGLPYEKKPMLIIKRVKFRDNIPAFRNEYVEVCKELGVDYFIVSDPDEWICEKLFLDIHKWIEWAEKHGFNQLGIRCIEKFEAIEWMDDLDRLKEVPGGYRESTYYKFLINKICCEEFAYRGVGKSKTVHETWGCPKHPRRGAYLPKEYYYVHEKSAYDIWRNASRNVFLGGGGDNVADLNPLWKPLREIASKLGCPDWTSFERYITSGRKLPPELIDWIKKALQMPPTDYGIETRQFAKFIIFHHRYLLNDPEIARLVREVPKKTPEVEVEEYVRKVYFQILGRHPDRQGLEYWKQQILIGRIRKEDLPMLLASSPEFREKHILTGERLSLKVPATVSIHLTEDVLINALMHSKTWYEEVKPKYDLGKFILMSIREPKEFIKWFYENRNRITLRDLIKKLMEASID